MELATTIILALLAGGGVGVGLVNLIRDQLQFRRERKAQREDRKEQKEDEVSRQLSVLGEAIKFLLYDRIKSLGTCYIKDNEIDIDDRSMLGKMHNVYHNGLKGNGDLDLLMKEVNNLPLKK